MSIAILNITRIIDLRKGITMQHLLSGYGNYEDQYIRVNLFQKVFLYIYIILSFYEGYLNQIIGPFTKVIAFLVICTFFMSYKKIKIEDYQIFFILWLFFKMLSISWSDNSEIDIIYSHFLSQIGMTAFLIVMTIVNFEEQFVKKIVDLMLFTSSSLGLLGIFFSHAYLGISESRQVLTLFGEQIDPNNLAALYLVGFAIALFNVVINNKFKVYNYAFLVIDFYAICLTASREALIATMIIIVFTVGLFIVSRRKSYKEIIIIIAGTIIIGISCIVLIQYLPQEVFERLFSFDTYAGGSNRDVLWATSINAFYEQPLFGWGWGGFNTENAGLDVGFHNTYLTMLCDIGIIGTALFIIPIISIFYRAVKRKNALAVLLLIACIIPSFFIDAINKRFFWNGIILPLMLLNSCPAVDTENCKKHN